MLVSLTVGKVDAGVAVLLTEDKRLIEFPSILLPPTISSGSIVDIEVSRNTASEAKAASTFATLQRTILTTFGTRTPTPPVLRVRNATQTAIVLEWDPLYLATAELRSLSLFRNGSKAGAIPRPHEMRATKISGLVVDKEYEFHLVLRTSAGTYTSDKVSVKTHKMTDLSGITVTPGIMPASLRHSLEGSIRRIGARLAEDVRIDTTHFVCTEGRGQQWEKAVEMNVPVVVPDWIKGCEREGRIVGVRGYYLNADPKLRQVGAGTIQEGREKELDQRRKSEVENQEAQAAADAGPVPPEKDESSDEDDEDEKPEPKTTAEDEQKARVEDVKDEVTEERRDSSDDESTEEPEEKGVADSPVSEASGKKEGREDNASFQDVAL